jgi:zinc transporter 1/2/3
VIVSSDQQIDDSRQNSINSKKSHITSYLLILALSIHSFFEGIALGLQKKMSELLYLIIAVVLHKWVEALSIVIFEVKTGD